MWGQKAGWLGLGHLLHFACAHHHPAAREKQVRRVVVRCGGAAVMGWWSGRGGGKGGGSCTPSGRAWLRQAWRVGRLWVAGMPPTPHLFICVPRHGVGRGCRGREVLMRGEGGRWAGARHEARLTRAGMERRLARGDAPKPSREACVGAGSDLRLRAEEK